MNEYNSLEDLVKVPKMSSLNEDRIVLQLEENNYNFEANVQLLHRVFQIDFYLPESK